MKEIREAFITMCAFEQSEKGMEFIMILLQKKRMLFIIAMVFISIFTYFLSISNLNKTIQTVSLPVTNKVVVLDAGHGRGR